MWGAIDLPQSDWGPQHFSVIYLFLSNKRTVRLTHSNPLYAITTKANQINDIEF